MRSIREHAAETAHSIRRFLRQTTGLEVGRYGESIPPVFIERRLRSLGVGLVIDGGANVGQYGEELRHIGYTGAIASFEPEPQAHFQLTQTIARRKESNWLAYQLALGDKPGELLMNVAQGSTFNSLRSTNKAATDFKDARQVTKQVPVKVVTLDDIMEHVRKDTGMTGPTFLKLDLQGYDLNALKGATKVLDQCVGVQTELVYGTPLYEGAPNHREVEDFLAQHGFAPALIHPINYEAFTIREADGIFFRKNLQLIT